MAEKKSIHKPIAAENSWINWRAFAYYSSLDRIRSHWWKHPGESISLREAASLAAMNPSYFSRFFHRKTGVTFKYWIDFMRIEHAMSLIHSTNMTIIELLEKCGFRDATTFTRTFRRITGLTPFEFKRSLEFSRAGWEHGMPKLSKISPKNRHLSPRRRATVWCTFATHSSKTTNEPRCTRNMARRAGMSRVLKTPVVALFAASFDAHTICLKNQ